MKIFEMNRFLIQLKISIQFFIETQNLKKTKIADFFMTSENSDIW